MPHAIIFGEDKILIQTSWNEKELIKQIPGGRYSAANNGWTLPLSWSSLVTLRGIFGTTFTYDDDILAWAANERKTRIDPAMALRSRTEVTPEYKEVTSEYDSRLYPFQRMGAAFLNLSGDALLGDEMGTGKTIQAIAALKQLGDDAFPVLIICPNSVKMNWAKELDEWYPEALPVVIAGPANVKRKLLTGPARLNPRAVAIINIEALRLHSRLAPYGSIALRRCRTCDPKHGATGITVGSCHVHEKELNVIPFKTVIVDEAHRIKDPHSQQTRAAWAIMHGPTVKRRWALTGTPLANDPSDLWSIMHGIVPKEFPSRSKFIDRYCLTEWNARGGISVIGVHPSTRDEFYRILDPRFRRMPKALVLQQLPQKIRTVRTVEMTPKQRKAYSQMRDQMLTWLNDGNILTVTSNLALRVRLMQLASSFAHVSYGVDGDWTSSTVELVEPSPKIDELMFILYELGDKPVVVAAESRKLIELAAARLTQEGISHSLITGRVSQWDRENNLRRFQAGETRVLLFTVKAGGTGLTMTRADTIVFMQRSDSMIDNVQAEDRVHRIGSEQHEAISVIDIVTADTVEIDQMRLLSEKLRRLDEVTRDSAVLAANGISTTHLDSELATLLNTHYTISPVVL